MWMVFCALSSRWQMVGEGAVEGGDAGEDAEFAGLEMS